MFDIVKYVHPHCDLCKYPRVNNIQECSEGGVFTAYRKSTVSQKSHVLHISASRFDVLEISANKLRLLKISAMRVTLKRSAHQISADGTDFAHISAFTFRSVI